MQRARTRNRDAIEILAEELECGLATLAALWRALPADERPSVLAGIVPAAPTIARLICPAYGRFSVGPGG